MAKHDLADPDLPESSRHKVDTTSHITLRAVITNRQAAIIIGESGSTINSLRTGNVEVDVSEQLRGAIERILTVNGATQDVAGAYTSIAKILLGENAEKPGSVESGSLSIRLAIPHVFLGAIIGSGGYRLRQIIESSATQIYVSEFCLPASSERNLSITGRADEIGLAIAEIGKDVLAQKAKAANATNNPFVPISMFGRYGHPESFRLTKPHDTMLTPSNPYGIAPASFNAPAPDPNSVNENIVLPSDPRQAAARGATKDKLTQQIYIPNDMVGAIIGKSGSKINEIRQLSGSHIKINEPDAARTNERLITVEGSQEQNQLALYMLYQRLESEKRRQ